MTQAVDSKPRTLFEKIWDAHVIRQQAGEPALLYIDLHLVHEVTSPQAFDGLRAAGRRVRRPDLTVATVDHNVPTTPDRQIIRDPISAQQIAALRHHCAEFGIRLFDIDSADQGIVHVIGPELGLTQPGITIVCGDSHTSTHGALGALAFGIGTSEVEHVLATQTLPQRKPKAMEVRVDGELPVGVTAKDIVLGIIGRIGIGGGVGHVIEYTGSAIRGLSMEGRMTVCNMSIEGGARAGMVAPDDTTFAYVEGRPHAPKDAAWERALEHWRSLATEDGATFDNEVTLDATSLRPYVSWGTNPAQSTTIDGSVPVPSSPEAERALTYMALEPGTPIRAIRPDTIFIGSCTNSRIEGTAIPLDRADVDTDQIIPARYLKRVERTGFGPYLFDEWRKDPAFIFNDARYAGASILLAGPNFGAGSSREHAVWAIEDFGFRAMIAPSFADIFRNNSL